MYNGISRSFVLGYLLGLAGMPLKTALGAALPPEEETDVPAMFLYNGMGPLPAPPEAIEGKPYITITESTDGDYRLYLSDDPFFAKIILPGTFNLANFLHNFGEKKAIFYNSHHLVPNGWTRYGTDSVFSDRYIGGGRVKGWANYDILTEEGDVYIHKSAPIPILGGKENPIAPSVFLAGLRFGILSRHSNALPELPDGVLISLDGYILTDCNGVYLIAKEE